MSKNIKGKNLDININITQAGTMNADIFNAYNDFTLNGVSIVNRIAVNEGDIALLNSEVITLQDEINANETDIATNTSDIATNTSDIATNTTDIATLQTSKQDVLTFDTAPTAGSTNPVTSQGIKTYVDNSTPSISATAPLNYNAGVISGTFDNAPTNGSINFLSSDKVYDALQLKQDEITSSTSLTTANITANGNIIGLGGLSGASVLVSGDIRTSGGDITATAGTITAPTIIQGTTNLLTQINTNTTDIIALQTNKQDTLTFDTSPTAGSTNPVTSQGIKTYVDNSLPSITATAPLNYNAGVISATFDSVPTNSSINFLNSNVIYDALQLKQDEITSTTNLTTGNIGVVGNLTAQGGVSGASLFSTGLVSGANLQATALVSGASLQLNNSAGNQITCAGTGNCIFSDVLCGDITSSGSISTTSGQIGTTSGSISTSSGDIITSTGDITAPSGTISAGTISATGASGTITAPIIIQGTTNLLNEINTKQDILTFDTAPTTGSTNPVTSQGIKTYVDNSTPSITATAPINYSGGVISGTFDNQPTQASINFLSSDKIFYALSLKQDLITASTALTCGDITTSGTLTLNGGNPIVNAGVYNGVGNIISSAGNVIGDNFITNSGTNLLTKINTKQDLITASTALTCGSVSTTAIIGNPVINSGAITSNANITTASNITCGGDLSAIGTGNNIDLRNNLVGGSGITLSQSGSTTTIENSSLPISNDVLGRSIFRGGTGGFNITYSFSSLWTSFVTPSSADTNLSRSYIIKEAGSQISVTFDVPAYTIGGVGNDEYLARLRYRYYNGSSWSGWAVCSSESSERWQSGEMRSGVLFPLSTSVTTGSNWEVIQFEAQAGRGSGDDTFTLSQRGQNYSFFYFEVTESRLYNGTPSNSYTNNSTAVTLGSLTTSSGNITSGGDIETTSGNIISGGDIETSSGNFLVTNSGDVECGDLQAENLIINTNLNSETFIRTIAIAKVLSGGANSKAINCSVNRTAVGRFTFTFTNPRPTADYIINITIAENSTILDDVIVQVVNGTQTANGFNYVIHEGDNSTNPGSYVDRPSFISIFDTD